MLLPIALEVKKVSPAIIVATSSTLWLGVLAGMVFSGKIIREIGYRNTVVVGLLIGIVSFILLPLLDWRWWAIPSATIGFGIGLRWIANETWLYRLAPAQSRGKIIGIHETLIGMASIIGLLVIVALGASKPSAFWAAAAIIAIGIPPLFIASTLPAVDKASAIKHQQQSKSCKFSPAGIFLLLGYGGIVAGIGGWIEGAIVALLPVYNAGIGLNVGDTAWLLTILGLGLMIFQFPIGWLAYTKGVNWTAKLCAVTGLTGIVVAMLFGTHFFTLAIAFFLLGGISGGLLTLCIVWATQHSTGVALTNNMRQVSITYTLLSAAGPLVAGFIVSHTNSSSLFWQQLVVIFVLILVLYRPQKKAN